jgi:hypothetical protein
MLRGAEIIAFGALLVWAQATWRARAERMFGLRLRRPGRIERVWQRLTFVIAAVFVLVGVALLVVGTVGLLLHLA